MPGVQDDWNFYFCNVNNSLASIYLNMGLGAIAPLEARPWLLWVWIYFQSPRSDGLSSQEEASTLFALEDLLSNRVAEACDAQLSGRITTQGRREFYFYGETTEDFEAAIRDALSSFMEYKFDFGSKLDTEWRQFWDVLFPSPEQIQCIMNRQVLESLERNGDIHSIARTVDHFLYFSTEVGRSLFCDAVVKDGFDVDRQSECDGKYSYGVQLTRLHSVEQEAIDAVVLNLMRLAEQFGGEYDGWGTTATSE